MFEELKGKCYGAILADPPWKYENPKSNLPALGGKTYPVMSLEEIKVMPVQSLTARDCLLFLWATCPKLREALEVITAWGFEYRTVAFTWIKINEEGKPNVGLGHWTRGATELCLLGKKGNPKRKSFNVSQVILAPRREHSRKPDQQYALIEELVDGPYLELFARYGWHNWDRWGHVVMDRLI